VSKVSSASDPAAAGGLSVSVATSRAEIEAIRTPWETLQAEPNADIDYFLTVVESRGDVERPHVIVVQEQERPIALLVGRIEESRLKIKLGAKTVFQPRIRQLRVAYGGVMGDWTEPAAEAAVAEVKRLMSEDGVDLVFFNHVDVDSPLHRVASAARGLLGSRAPDPAETHWMMTLPDRYEEFEQGLSRNKRKQWRRHARRFEEEFGDAIRITCYRDVADLDRIMADSEAIESKSYHRGLQVGFVDDDETRRRFRRSLEKGWLRVYILYVEGVPRAFQYLQIYGRTIFAYGTAYDPDFRKYGIGNYLLVHVLKEFAGDPGIDHVDFGFGDATYKSDICDIRREEASLYLFRPGLRGTRVFMQRYGALMLGNVLERTLKQADWYERVKASWRRRSEAGGTGNGDRAS
jgi:CelD/BcsL family acetyltransferase involved in cellulose biosynthesis